MRILLDVGVAPGAGRARVTGRGELRGVDGRSPGVLAGVAGEAAVRVRRRFGRGGAAGHKKNRRENGFCDNHKSYMTRQHGKCLLSNVHAKAIKKAGAGNPGARMTNSLL